MGTHKILNIGLTILSIVAISIVLGFLALTAFGIRPYVIKSGSMEPLYPTGSLCFVNTHISVDDLVVGDVVVYKEINDIRVMHRLIEVDDGYILKGDAAATSKRVELTDDNLIGVTVYSSPALGVATRAIMRHKLLCIGIAVGLIVLACLPARALRRRK